MTKKYASLFLAILTILCSVSLAFFSASAATGWLDVTKDGAPVRSDCKKSAPAVKTLACGTILQYTGSVTNSAGNLWYKVPGGYIFSGNTAAHSRHQYGWSVAKAPTCMRAGVRRGRCVCGATVDQTIDRVGHAYSGGTFMCSYGCGNYDPNSVRLASAAQTVLYVKKDAIAHTGPYGDCPTAVRFNKGRVLTSLSKYANGYGNVWYRLDSGLYIAQKYVTEHNSHTWNGGKVTKAATCRTAGEKTLTCTLCGATKKEAVAKAAHKYGADTYVCVYGCGKFDPNSVTVTDQAAFTLYAVKEAKLRSGPYEACRAVKTVAKGAAVSVAATVKNACGNKWYRLTDGNYLFAGNAAWPSIKLITDVTTAFVGIGKTLKATVFPAGTPVTWSSSDPAAATVSDQGAVSFQKVGQVIIKASIVKDGKTYSAACVVTGCTLIYKVRFAGNGSGATLTGMKSDTVSRAYGKAYTAPGAIFTRTGYTLLGWSKTPDGDAEIPLLGSYQNLSKKNSETVTLYAVWRANELRVTYNANGGEAAGSTVNGKTYYNSLDAKGFAIHGTSAGGTERYCQKLYYNTAKDFVNASTLGLSKTGYRFDGWNTKADGSGQCLSETDAYVPADLRPALKKGDVDLVLYATWVPNVYTVRYNANGGSGTVENQRFTYDRAGSLRKNAFTNGSFVFLGWSTAANGDPQYKSGQKDVKNLSTGKTVTLYAVWGYTVTLNANGGEGDAQKLTAVKGRAVTLPNCGYRRAGFWFAGWDTKKDGSGERFGRGQTTDRFAKSAKATLYAVWQPGYVYNGVTYNAVSGFEGAVAKQKLSNNCSSTAWCMGLAIVHNDRSYIDKATQSPYWKLPTGAYYIENRSGLKYSDLWGTSYNEIVAGRPVYLMAVNGNRNTRTHAVLLVGISDEAMRTGAISPESFLVIDPGVGRIRTLSEVGFITWSDAYICLFPIL